MSALPEILEPRRRQLGIANRVLDILVAEVGLQGPRIVALVGQREAAGVPQHVRVGLEAEPGSLASALHKPGKACRGERRAALGGEHERRLAAPARAAAGAVRASRRR